MLIYLTVLYRFCEYFQYLDFYSCYLNRCYFWCTNHELYFGERLRNFLQCVAICLPNG